MAVAADLEPSLDRVDGDVAEGDEGCGLVTFVAEHPVDGREGALGCRAGEHHRSPGDAEGDADGGFGRPVPADVTDHGPDGAVVAHDGVVEVAAEERVGAGAIAGGRLKVWSVDVEHGEQAAGEAIVLGLLALGEEEPDAVSLGTAALDGEANGLGDAEAVDLALHEVVLGAGSHRGDAALAVVEAGQHDDRQVGRPVAEADDRLDALGVGEPEVDERAVVAREPPRRPRRSTPPGPCRSALRSRPGAPRRAARRRRRPPPTGGGGCSFARRPGGHRGASCQTCRRSSPSSGG